MRHQKNAKGLPVESL